MTKEEIMKKAIECGENFRTMCASNMTIDRKFNAVCAYNCEYTGVEHCDVAYGYEHGFAEGVAEGKRLASEKQIPKKIGVDGYGWYECSECHNKRPNWLLGKDAKWCPYCGQKLGWGEGESE